MSCYWKDFGFSEAIDVDKHTVIGLCEKLGKSHLNTFIAKDNVATAYFDRSAFGFGNPEDLDLSVTIRIAYWSCSPS